MSSNTRRGGSVLQLNRKCEPSRRSGSCFVYISALCSCCPPRDSTFTRSEPMGKSEKKARAESINKLRKQYDAFLEEDRKRKERNDDILSKLDKMRNTITRHKGNVYLDPRSPLPSFGEIPSNFIRYSDHLIPMPIDVRNKHIDETYFLSQISKKYILIPKLRPMIDNDYSPTVIKQDNNNDSDWKSKYSILDKLKQTEKEEADNAPTVNNQNVKYDVSRKKSESKCLKDDDQTDSTEKHNNVENIQNKLADEFTSAEITLHGLQGKQSATKQTYKDDRRNEELSLDMNSQEKCDFESNLLKSNEEFNISNNKGNARDSSNIPQQLHLNCDSNLKISPSVNNLPVAEVHEQVEPILNENIAAHHNLGENDSKHETEVTEKAYFEPGDIRHVEVIHAVKLPQEGSDDTVNRGDTEDRNYPIDVINVKDFTPNNDVTLVDGVNINPEGHEAAYYAQGYQHSPETIIFSEHEKNISQQEPVNVTEKVNPGLVTGEVYNDPSQQYGNLEEQITDDAYNEPLQQYDTTSDMETMENVLGIQAFEAEQNEMFYSEQPAQHYEQYNQEGDAYNAGYSEPMEGYDPTAYYESAQQEAFPVEINEHEETSQRYDPIYEQQYVTTNVEGSHYAEQTQYAEPAQNEPEELIPTQLELDQTQYNADQLGVTEQVEQQLDHEAGYLQHKLDDIAQGVDGSAPYQQIPDQTLMQNVANIVIPEKQT